MNTLELNELKRKVEALENESNLKFYKKQKKLFKKMVKDFEQTKKTRDFSYLGNSSKKEKELIKALDLMIAHYKSMIKTADKFIDSCKSK